MGKPIIQQLEAETSQLRREQTPMQSLQEIGDPKQGVDSNSVFASFVI
jgi:hypothetical protein